MIKKTILCLSLMLMFVLAASASGITLKWDAPTRNADGSPLEDLAGFVVYYGTAPGEYEASFDVGLETQTTLGELQTGITYYFAVRAYNQWNWTSAMSQEIYGVIPEHKPNSGLSTLILII